MTSTSHAFTDELATLDAVATAAAIESGELSAAEVVAAAIERSRKVDPELGAVAAEGYEKAQQIAANRVIGPFGGVPTFIKDMTNVAGLPTRHGSEAFAAAPPATTTFGIAQQMFDMGMVCLGKSTLPEFGFTPSTEFPDGTATHNPWNLDHTPGGSSGGAGALVAAGVVPIAHGQDGGGSIRVPAACCGLVGLKPTRGRLLPDPHAKLLPLNVVVDGVLTRSVRDTAAYYAAAEGRYRNPKLPPVGHVTRPLERKLRIGAMSDSPVDIEIDVATRREFERTVSILEDLGHSVEPMEPPVDEQFATDFVQYWSLLAYSVFKAGGRLFEDPTWDRTKLSALTVGLAEQFRSRISTTPGAIRRLRRSGAEHERLYGSMDLILSPTLAHLPPPLGHLGMTLPFDVLFPRVEQWVGFTPLANATGGPAISLPIGHDRETNLPVGMMFSAAHGREDLLLELALQIEAAHPWKTLAS